MSTMTLSFSSSQQHGTHRGKVQICNTTYLPKSGRQQSAMVVREACPACGAERYKRNGHLLTGKQNHSCKACGRQVVLDATNHMITAEQHTLVERASSVRKSPSMACAARLASGCGGSCPVSSCALRRGLTICLCSLWPLPGMCASGVLRWKQTSCGAS